ncbi:uncharacterized protein KGF55_004809 [Candida pseudojiufengensis]|uniref:uncharacterized protein n=1 Tax=Candida pseudojiufengensis TaxID=497109 RepID=UPI002225A13F|nr:uncharacterized protein KGF55_004809 [Candida pseudojiufengensis]KAI5960086.1 hypothetical protein KGF55_004809 [Candida pseudojiufengensis]
MSLKKLYSQLILQVPSDQLEFGEDERLERLTRALLDGKYAEVIEISDYKEISSLPDIQNILKQYPQKPLIEVLQIFTNKLFELTNKFIGENSFISLQSFAIAFLQLFIQSNFTGPPITLQSHSIFFPNVDQNKVQKDAVRALCMEGQQAYDLMQDPIYLIVSELIFEKLMNIPIFQNFNTESLLNHIGTTIQKIDSPLKASISWWFSRALQIHASVLSDTPSIISSICGILLNDQLLLNLIPEGDKEIKKLLEIQFLLEQARINIHAKTEHSATTPLIKAFKLSKLQLLLSGAKAKRTKYQKFFTSNLIVLGKSYEPTLYDYNENNKLEKFQLDSDLLLEKPEFDSLENLNLELENVSKKIKLDPELLIDDLEADRLLPLAMKVEDIPSDLKELDPNNQPPLNNIDVLQVLLRLAVIKQTSPSNDPLVEEELLALVARILYSNPEGINWLLFSRALWERSILETSKSRTIERGLLQMTSLVEEMGLKIKTRLLPQTQQQENLNEIACQRLRFIHQLPLLPQWVMDVKLAETYMSLGVLKSALEIYEGLELYCEAALCYAAVGKEEEAEKILIGRIKEFPTDARAISILGDIKQDPSLWEKSWEIGKYPKAKASLSKYYYSQKNLEAAIANMFDCLTANPLNFENWYFYGCCGLESGQFELASEAFTRCVSLDDTNSYAWSNLASSLLKLDKKRPAFNALQKAIRCGGDKKSWRIFENYMNVASQLNEWNDVLFAYNELIQIKKNDGDSAIDLPMLEKLAEILISSDYNDTKLTHFQKTCIDLICNKIPSIITSSSRCWKIVARVELWRQKPWLALEYNEKAYRVLLHNPELESNENIWNEVVEACDDLVSAFESLGELPGKHGAGDLVCKDWKYKARTTIRSLMSKGKDSWEDSKGWEKLIELKEQLNNH